MCPHLYFPRSHVAIDAFFRAQGDAAYYLNYVLAAQGLRRAVHVLFFRGKDQLHYPANIAQVDKNQPAEVATLSYPAAKPNLFSYHPPVHLTGIRTLKTHLSSSMRIAVRVSLLATRATA